MNRSQKLIATAGALLLTLTNAVVLVGVASNRRQPPDSVLTLTERELGPQWSWMWRNGDNSGLSLHLQYRVESARSPKPAVWDEDDRFSAYSSFGPVAWLDQGKLAALGFDVATPPALSDKITHYDRMLGRDVLLVLELDGPVHARALQAARDLVARRQHESADNSEHEGRAEKLQSAQEALQREEHEASRLFIVDAGLDQVKLRQRYPDRAHYAIVHGNIRPFVLLDGTSAKFYGSVTAVRCETINVPLQFQTAVRLDGPAEVITIGRPEKKLTFTTQVAFGSHLEPWIVSAHAGPT